MPMSGSERKRRLEALGYRLVRHYRCPIRGRVMAYATVPSGAGSICVHDDLAGVGGYWLLRKFGSGNVIKDNYPGGVCPDCGELIPDDCLVGQACENCGHVFYDKLCLKCGSPLDGNLCDDCGGPKPLDDKALLKYAVLYLKANLSNSEVSDVLDIDEENVTEGMERGLEERLEAIYRAL